MSASAAVGQGREDLTLEHTTLVVTLCNRTADRRFSAGAVAHVHSSTLPPRLLTLWAGPAVFHLARRPHLIST
jgi:hypothetical protein